MRYKIRLNRIVILFLLMGFFFASNIAAAMTTSELDLTGYQEKDGAITVSYGDTVVDPYFAMRALLLAHEEGLKYEKLHYRGFVG